MCSWRRIAPTAVLLLTGGCGGPDGGIVQKPAATAGRLDATVARVVDGDTVMLAPGGPEAGIGQKPAATAGRCEPTMVRRRRDAERALRPYDGNDLSRCHMR